MFGCWGIRTRGLGRDDGFGTSVSLVQLVEGGKEGGGTRESQTRDIV